MLKVAIVGAGHIGVTHAQVYRDNPDTQLVAICDQQTERGEVIAREHGIKLYSSVDEMLRNEELDAVSVCTGGFENGSHHYEPVMQCLRAGKAVLCEKPISNNIEEAREMARAARDLNLPFGINLNHRFTPPAQRLKKLQLDGDLGETLFVNIALWFSNPADVPPYLHIRALHPHSIDVMRYYGGDIARVHCFMTRETGKVSSWSTLSLNVQFASGAVGCLTGSHDMSWQHPIEYCEVGGSKGRATLKNVYERLEFFPRESNEKMVIENGIMGGMNEFNDTFIHRIGRFVEQVQKGEPLDASGDDGLAAQEVIEAAIRSHETGTVVEVPKI